MSLPMLRPNLRPYGVQVHIWENGSFEPTFMAVPQMANVDFSDMLPPIVKVWLKFAIMSSHLSI